MESTLKLILTFSQHFQKPNLTQEVSLSQEHTLYNVLLVEPVLFKTLVMVGP